jgi:hypothetical protein
MDNQKKDLRLHKLVQIDKLEASTMYEGKWVANISIEGILKDRFFISEKQARSIERCKRYKDAFCVMDHAPEKGPRFVFASTNADWLCTTFEARRDTPAVAAAVETVKPMPYTEMTEADLPF